MEKIKNKLKISVMVLRISLFFLYLLFILIFDSDMEKKKEQYWFGASQSLGHMLFSRAFLHLWFLRSMLQSHVNLNRPSCGYYQ